MPFTTLIGSLRSRLQSCTFGFVLNGTFANSFPLSVGVYVIWNPTNGDALYVGKAGTVLNPFSVCALQGTPGPTAFSNQTLRGRVANRQCQMSRVAFYRQVMQFLNTTSLNFECFMTHQPGQGSLFPFEVEGQLLAAHIRQFGRLPLLNKEA